MEPNTVLRNLRSLLDDSVKDYLWSDDDLVGFIDEGYKRFARDTRTLTDLSTPDVAVYSVPASSESIALSPLIVDITDAIDATNDRRLKLANSNTVPFTGIKEGWVQYVIGDREKGKLHFYQLPATDFQLKLRVVRLPLESFSRSMVSALEYDDHRAWTIINYYAAALAYLKDDVDTQDLLKSTMMENKYNAEVIEYEIDERNARRVAGVTTYGGL